MADDDTGKAGRKPALSLNGTMLRKLVVVALLMFGFGYALIPIYRTICELTGVNLLTPKDSSVEPVGNTQIDKTRKITVEFDANAHGPWRFRPTVSSMQVHPGEMVQVVYEVVNKQPREVYAQAIPSYVPNEAAVHFKKLDCFCFQQQKLGPNEARQMAVAFYVDPALPKNVKTVTLSYAFFEIAGKNKDAG